MKKYPTIGLPTESSIKSRSRSCDGLYNVGSIRGAWRWDLERLEKLPPGEEANGFDAVMAIVRHYASLDENDKALDWLEKGYEKHAPGMAAIKVDPSYDSLRSDPRFQNLLRRMNFPQ